MDNAKIFDIYLKNGIIKRIGGNDKVYASVIKATNSITTLLVKNPDKIVPFTLVALDDAVKEDEATLKETEAIVFKHWKTVHSQFPQMPKTLYRAIILQGLENLIEKDAKYSSIIWFGGIDAYPFLSLKTKEEKVLRNFLQKIGDKAEEYATTEWSVDEKEKDFKLNTVKIVSTGLKGKVDVTVLTEGMEAASGPAKTGNIIISGGNRYYSNSGQHWCWSFAPKAAQAISTSVNSALSEIEIGLDENIKQVETSVNDFTKSLKTALNKTLADAKKSSVAVERRSQILWWKESLYSKSLDKTYRKLSKFETAITMAFDLDSLLPSIYPISVDYIFREAFYKVHGSQDNTVTIGDFLSEFDDIKNKDFLENFFAKETRHTGRGHLTFFLEKILFEKTDIQKEIKARTGITMDKKMSYEDIGVWILHGFTVESLTS